VSARWGKPPVESVLECRGWRATLLLVVLLLTLAAVFGWAVAG